MKGLYVVLRGECQHFLDGNVGSEHVKQYKVVITDALRETVIEMSIRTLLATLKVFNIIYPATIRYKFENRQRRGHGISL